MPTSKEYLIRVLQEHRQDFILRVSNKLQKFPYSHYETISFEQHQEREELFLNALLQHLHAPEAGVLATYAQKLCQQRSNEGYTLEEVERAFDIVEDTLWEVLTKYCPLEASLIEVLAIVRKIFQEVKNLVSQCFLHDTLSAQKQFENIRRKFAAYRQEAYIDFS